MPSYLGNKKDFHKKYKALLDLNLLSLDMKKMELNNK